MMRAIVLVLLAMIGALPARAQEVPLVADLSNHLVAITTGFSGTDVLLFGATDGPGDIVVVVRGPARDEIVRRKGRFGPIWANADSVTFRAAPAYYRVASSRPLDEFATETILARQQIGLENIRLLSTDETLPAEQTTAFREALVRLKAEESLYEQGLSDITLMSNRLFRTALHFPANVPIGTYMVEVYLFREGQITAAEIVPLTISKIGVGADIFDFAHGPFAFFYGLLAVLLAASAGLAAGAVFKRV
jgi:uncharacterized protein (TIGR02186 family)